MDMPTTRQAHSKKQLTTGSQVAAPRYAQAQPGSSSATFLNQMMLELFLFTTRPSIVLTGQLFLPYFQTNVARTVGATASPIF